MKNDRLFTKDFSLVLLTTFFVFVNHFMLVSTFPFYIEKLGGTEAVAGAAAVLFCVIGVICRPFVGWLLDSGKRKRILFIGIVGIILMSLGYWLVSVLVLTFLLRMIHGASLIFAATSGSTITTDIVPRNKLARGMGMFGMSVALATAVSPSLGLFLMSRGGFSLLFPLSALIMGAGLVLFFFLKAPEIELKKKPLIVRDLFEQNALPSSLTIVMFMMTFGAVENFMAKYGAEAGLPGGLYFLTMAAVVILTRIVLGRFTDRKGEPFFVYVCNAAMLLSFLLLAFVPSLPLFFLSAVLTGFAFGGIEPALMTMAVRLAPPERRGAANSTFLCSYDIGIGVGGGIAGYLITRLGYPSMFVILTAGNVISCAVYFFWARKQPSAFRNLETAEKSMG